MVLIRPFLLSFGQATRSGRCDRPVSLRTNLGERLVRLGDQRDLEPRPAPHHDRHVRGLARAHEDARRRREHAPVAARRHAHGPLGAHLALALDAEPQRRDVALRRAVRAAVAAAALAPPPRTVAHARVRADVDRARAVRPVVRAARDGPVRVGDGGVVRVARGRDAVAVLVGQHQVALLVDHAQVDQCLELLKVKRIPERAHTQSA
jgi:hypothetical protein